jgi:hypothetical protein
MSGRKQRTRDPRRWWKSIAIWTVVIAAFGMLIAALQVYYSDKQSEIAEESIIITKEEVERGKPKPSVRYYLLDRYSTQIIFSPWLKSDSDNITKEDKEQIARVVLSDLRLDHKPLLLRTEVADYFATMEQKEWEGSVNAVKVLQKSNNLIDIVSADIYWGGVVHSNKIELGATSYPSLGNPEIRSPRSLFLNVGEVSYPVIYASDTDGCAFDVNDIIYPNRYALVADIANNGNAPLKDFSVSGKLFEPDPYALSLLGKPGEEGKTWNISVPFPLEPGEHVFLYLATIYSHNETWGSPSEPWFVMGPHISLGSWQYFDAVSNASEVVPIRQFNINNMVTVSGNIWRGSCPYIVFLNSDGDILKEQRFLIEAIGLENERDEVISIPSGTSKILIEERDPEISYIKNIELYSGASLDRNIGHESEVIKLHQGDSYRIPIDPKHSSVKIRGYYDPL